MSHVCPQPIAMLSIRFALFLSVCSTLWKGAASTPPISYRNPSLSTLQCNVVDMNSYSGDDGGLIWYSPSYNKVYYEGDSNIVRYSSGSNLVYEAGFNSHLESVHADPVSGQIYQLMSGSNALAAATTFTDVKCLDVDLTVRSTVPLSSSFTLSNPYSIYIGDQALVARDSVGNWQLVSLACIGTLAVTTLGSSSALPLRTCERGRQGGMLEFDGMNFYIFYARNDGTVWKRVIHGPAKDQEEQLVSTRLSDICSLSFDYDLGRWYFHAENLMYGSSSYAESLASCPASFQAAMSATASSTSTKILSTTGTQTSSSATLSLTLTTTSSSSRTTLTSSTSSTATASTSSTVTQTTSGTETTSSATISETRSATSTLSSSTTTASSSSETSSSATSTLSSSTTTASSSSETSSSATSTLSSSTTTASQTSTFTSSSRTVTVSFTRSSTTASTSSSVTQTTSGTQTTLTPSTSETSSATSTRASSTASTSRTSTLSSSSTSRTPTVSVSSTVTSTTLSTETIAATSTTSATLFATATSTSSSSTASATSSRSLASSTPTRISSQTETRTTTTLDLPTPDLAKATAKMLLQADSAAERKAVTAFFEEASNQSRVLVTPSGTALSLALSPNPGDGNNDPWQLFAPASNVTDSAVSVSIPSALLSLLSHNGRVALAVGQLSPGAQKVLEAASMDLTSAPVSITLYGPDGNELKAVQLPQPITLTLRANATEDDQCVFWEENSGMWSTEGIKRIDDGSSNLVCETNHLSLFGSIAKAIVRTLVCSNMRAILSVEGLKTLLRTPSWTMRAPALTLWSATALFAFLLFRAKVADLISNEIVLTAQEAHQQALRKQGRPPPTKKKTSLMFSIACTGGCHLQELVETICTMVRKHCDRSLRLEAVCLADPELQKASITGLRPWAVLEDFKAEEHRP
eukprot:TRINITY_DN3217_c0_g1_i1.p1 TRINITY_DN3217_c0_g1~~TRINITY_DN3217_c0_g1_i1.p1  ORF type:complete len:933 (+),score=127.99 TRINITY_DN3217_c0_g1_i1:25-2799(+)